MVAFNLLACDTESVLRTFKTLYLFLGILRILVPVLIVVLGTKEMMNTALSGNNEDLKKATKSLTTKILAGLIVFMIPGILDAIFNIIANYESKPSEFAGCTVCLTNDKECDSLMAIAQEKARLENEQLRAEVRESHKVSDEDLENYKRREAEIIANQKNKQNNKWNTTKNGYFNSEDVTQISGLTEQQFINVLQNSTAYKGKAKVYIPLAKDLILAEKNHGVNAFYLIGLYSYESGWLGSTLTKKCNNIGGVRYYSQSYGNGKTTTDCWKRYAGFDSISEFVDFHANLLEKKYLTPGASHYHGTSVAAIAKDYGSGNGIDTIIQIATRVSTT